MPPPIPPTILEPSSKSSTPRRLIVCIDGTSNQFSEKNTNVIELYKYIEKNESQHAYYVSGVGTFAKPTWRSLTYFKQVLSNTGDLAIAWNFEKTMFGAYRWLANEYRDGDQIFLFGFSRGAYQVRCLAGMIESVGILYAGNDEQVPFAWELYAEVDCNNEAHMLKIDLFKKTLSRKAEVYFLGAWDTVSSIGLRRSRLYHLSDKCDHIRHFRHALALDERRVKFLPECICVPGETHQRRGHTAKEVWFTGTHSDIGGGITANPNLSGNTEAFRWVMDQAEQVGLDLCRTRHSVCVQNRLSPVITESLVGAWKLVELLPVTWYSPWAERTRWWLHRGKGREVKINQIQSLHWSVLRNHNLRTEYEPKASFFEDKKGPYKCWNDIFESWENSGEAEFKLPVEDEENALKTLEFIQTLDTEYPVGLDWLTRLYEYAAHSDKSNIFWAYGGDSFIRKLVLLDARDPRLEAIIKSVIGFKHSNKHDVRSVEVLLLRLDTLVLSCYANPNHPNFDENTRILALIVVNMVAELLRVVTQVVKIISKIAERVEGQKKLLSDGSKIAEKLSLVLRVSTNSGSSTGTSVHQEATANTVFVFRLLAGQEGFTQQLVEQRMQTHIVELLVCGVNLENTLNTTKRLTEIQPGPFEEALRLNVRGIPRLKKLMNDFPDALHIMSNLVTIDTFRAELDPREMANCIEVLSCKHDDTTWVEALFRFAAAILDCGEFGSQLLWSRSQRDALDFESKTFESQPKTLESESKLPESGLKPLDSEVDVLVQLLNKKVTSRDGLNFLLKIAESPNVELIGVQLLRALIQVLEYADSQLGTEQDIRPKVIHKATKILEKITLPRMHRGTPSRAIGAKVLVQALLRLYSGGYFSEAVIDSMTQCVKKVQYSDPIMRDELVPFTIRLFEQYTPDKLEEWFGKNVRYNSVIPKLVDLVEFLSHDEDYRKPLLRSSVYQRLFSVRYAPVSPEVIVQIDASMRTLRELGDEELNTLIPSERG